MDFRITLNYLEHSGGTKFYETVLITELNADEDSVLLKRYGKITAKAGGGEVLIERQNHGLNEKSQSKILREKRNKGYEDVAMIAGLPMHELAAAGTSVTSAMLAAVIEKQYRAAEATQILNHFGIQTTAQDQANMNGEIIEEGIVIEAEKDDPTWGTW